MYWIYVIVFILEAVSSGNDEIQISVKNASINSGASIESNSTTIHNDQKSADLALSASADQQYEGEMEIAGWEKNKTRDLTKYIKPFEDTATITGQICRDPVQLVIMVTSAPTEFKFRTVVRSTWASRLPQNMGVGFFLGAGNSSEGQERVVEESRVFKDIVQDDFVDSYNNLTLKSISILKWFIRQCPEVRYLMKVDADTYLSVKALGKVLGGLNKTGVLLGDVDQGEPHRNDTSKWYIPRYLYEKDVYPEYLRGSGYLMSRDVVAKLFEAALVTPIIHLEDVYVTGLCAQIAGVTPKKLPGMMRGCPRRRRTLSCHPAPIALMVRMMATETLEIPSTYVNATSTSSMYTNIKSPTANRIRISMLRQQWALIPRSSANQSILNLGIAHYFIVLAVIYCTNKVNVPQ